MDCRSMPGNDIASEPAFADEDGVAGADGRAERDDARSAGRVWVSVTLSRLARGEKPPAIATALSTLMFGT